MSVYIDDALIKYKRFLMSHMMADANEELDDFAVSIGCKLKWKHGDHFDVCQSKKRLAISKGAIPVTAFDLVMLRRKRLDQKGMTKTNDV